MTEKLKDYTELSVDEIFEIYRYRFFTQINNHHNYYFEYKDNNSYLYFEPLESTLKIAKTRIEYRSIFGIKRYRYKIEYIFHPTTKYFNKEHKLFYTQENWDKAMNQLYNSFFVG